MRPRGRMTSHALATMKIRPPTQHPPLPPPAAAGLVAVLLGLTLDAHSAPFVYTPTDLVLVFRQPGNASDLVVNLGKVTAYNGLPAGTTRVVDALNTAQLKEAFPTLNDLQWLVAGANRPPANDAFPLQSLWITAPRLDPETPATPWIRKGQFVQGNAASQVDALGVNAALTSSLLPGGPNNTATAVTLPVSAAYPVEPVIGPDGNLSGAFQGRVESVTPSDFDATPAAESRADLVELLPGTTAAGTLNQPGRTLGTFALRPDGSLVFRVPAASAPAATIRSITRAGQVTSVTFSSASGARYRLRRTDATGLLAPLQQWTSLETTVAGTGGDATLQDTHTGDAAFYGVESLP